jgi:conjugal transfer/entry exclusion protein
MGISAHLPPSNFSLEEELTSWANDNIHQYEKRAAALTSEVRQLDDQAQSLQQLLDGAKSSMDAKSRVNLNDPAIAPTIQKLKEVGVNIPIPPEGILTKETIVDWMKIVDDDRVQIANQVQRLQAQIPAALGHLKETLEIIMRILQQVHEIISLIIRNMSSHAK